VVGFAADPVTAAQTENEFLDFLHILGMICQLNGSAIRDAGWDVETMSRKRRRRNSVLVVLP
jgi:hypothetical protein